MPSAYILEAAAAEAAYWPRLERSARYAQGVEARES